MATSDAELFRSIGLVDAVVAPLEKNTKLAAKLVEVIVGAGLAGKGCDSVTGNLLYHVASKMKDSLARHRAFMGQQIASGALRLNVQVNICAAY